MKKQSLSGKAPMAAPLFRGNAISGKSNVLERLGKVEVVVENLQIGQQHMDDKLSAIIDALNQSRSTDWKTLAAWSGVLLTVIITVGNMAIDSAVRPVDIGVTTTNAQVTTLIHKVEELEKNYGVHSQLPVHPVAQQQLSEMEKRVTELRALFKLVPNP